MKGDSIDNIPGAPGIGDKGARDLIARFGSVENAIERAAEVERKMYRESLQNHKDQILMSKKLATIDTQTPVDWCLESLLAQEPDIPVLKSMYRELEFFSLLKELGPTESTADKDYKSLLTADEVDAFVAEIPAGAPIAISVGTGIGVAYKAGQARGVPFELAGPIQTLIEDPNRAKIVHDVKAMTAALEAHGIAPAGIRHDVMLYAFLLSSDPSTCGCEVLAEKYLDRKLGSSADTRADCALELYVKLVAADRRARFSESLRGDRPAVGGRAAENGADRHSRGTSAAQALSSTAWMWKCSGLTQQIHGIAGAPFNINSPQQLAKVLYEDLKLPAPMKYGKGKTTSTAADILEELAVEHPIARLVLEYRQLAKLKGTYVDALPRIDRGGLGPAPHDVQPDGSGDGRLSSSNPNLQNIPIRTELGREIRAAFVPQRGLGSDRRRLFADRAASAGAHVARPGAGRARSATAKTFTREPRPRFSVSPPLMVTPEMRRNAKAVNFGIVYGQTPFGLAAAARNRPERSGRSISALFRTLFGRKAIYRPDDRRGTADGRGKDAARTGAADSGYACQESECHGRSQSGRR